MECKEKVLEMISRIAHEKYLLKKKVVPTNYYHIMDLLGYENKHRHYKNTELNIVSCLIDIYRDHSDDTDEKEKLIEIIKYMEMKIFTDELSGDYDEYKLGFVSFTYKNDLELLREFMREYGDVE